MDQQKIGKFLKCLRKGKGLTQEQLAEHFCVSSRTISRWENGNNMPDVDILMELADFYEVDLRELVDGERKSEAQVKETKETVFKAAEYMNAGTEQYTKRVHLLLLAGGEPLVCGEFDRPYGTESSCRSECDLQLCRRRRNRNDFMQYTLYKSLWAKNKGLQASIA